MRGREQRVNPQTPAENTPVVEAENPCTPVFDGNNSAVPRLQ